MFARPIGISSGQVGAFQELLPDDNSREMQPLNGRDVQSDAERVLN